MKNILRIDIQTLEDMDDTEEYKDYNNSLTDDVNKWLRGDLDDYAIMKYDYDCSYELIGIWNAFSIAEYLQKRNII